MSINISSVSTDNFHVTMADSFHIQQIFITENDLWRLTRINRLFPGLNWKY